MSNVWDLDIDLINKAFSPAIEIQNPQLFVGRRDEIRSAMFALMNKGSLLTIYGLRGVGKSSIANQIKLIAEGNCELVKLLGLERFLPQKGFNFIVYYFTIDDSIPDTSTLFQHILSGDAKNPPLISYTKRGDRHLSEIKKTFEAEGGINLFGVKATGKTTTESIYKNSLSNNFILQFEQLLSHIHKDHQDKTGLLILIDEFDKFKDKQGFASLVKNLSSEHIKFGVVGIASDITELIKDHTSIGRKIDLVKVPLMPTEELARILRKGEFIVKDHILFDDEAIEMITKTSEGFPYFTHLLGRYSMLLAFEKGSNRITCDDITNIYREISNDKLKVGYEEIYQKIVRNAPNREVFLKILASVDEDEINLDLVYASAKELGLSHPSQLLNDILEATPKDEQVLKLVRERTYRFDDPVFKVYARIRRFKFK